MAAVLGSCHPGHLRVHLHGRRTTIGPGLMLATALVVSACGATQDSATTKSTSAVSLPTSVATESSAALPFDPLAAVMSYEVALDNLYLDAATPLDSFHAVAVTPDFITETSAVARFRQQGYRQVGRRSVVTATFVSGGAAGGSALSSAMRVTSCIDVRAVRGVNKDGASIVAADRKPFLLGQLTFLSSTSGGATSWKVSQTQNEQASSCPG